jgi:hypothetical protein
MFKECLNAKTNIEKTTNAPNPAVFYIFTIQNKLTLKL